MELFKAHNQWKTRPADERFPTLAAMHFAVQQYRASAAEASVALADLRVEAVNDDLCLVGRTGVPASLTHWSTGQMAQRAQAPAAYLRTLPATLAAQNINHGLKARSLEEPGGRAQLLFHSNGSLVLRSALSEQYARIWNAEVTERLLRFQGDNPQWKNPLAYRVTAPGTDGKWPSMTGEMEPAGLYASDHDMFAFLVDESRTLEGGPKGVNVGFFAWNSEVGASSQGFMGFTYDRVCGNNIVWGAGNVTEMRIRHTGSARDKSQRALTVELRKYADDSASELEGKIKKARSFELGHDKKSALDFLTGAIGKLKLRNDLTDKRVLEAMEVAEKREDRYGNPRSLWGVVGGLTEASQWQPHTDDRMRVDRAAGKLLTIAF